MTDDPACPDDNVLTAMLEGALGPADIAEIHAHVDGCATCRALLVELGRGVEHTRPSSPSPRTERPAGSRLGRYEILDLLGSGGMGLVYLAFDAHLDRQIALKVLHTSTEHAQRRILREARAMARVSHPHVVQVHEVGEYDGGSYVAMELVAGATLDQWAEGRPWVERLEACCQAGEGLAAAHAAGLVHRDFKPANVLCGRDGQVKVTDFGLAATERIRREELMPTSVIGPRAATLDVTGAAGGTPAYMAPEQQRGDEADARADQFSFCVATWQVLFGERPTLPHPTPSTASDHGGHGTRPRATAGLRRGLSADPDDRWPSMADLLAELRYEPRRRRRDWAIGLASALGVGLLGAGASVWSSDSPPCRNAGVAAMDEQWSDRQRQQVRDALLAGGSQYDRTAALVQRRLDDFTQAWTDMSRSACEAALVERTQSTELLDLRTACLGRAAESVEATIEVLRSADADTRSNAHILVGNLPRLERCADVSELRAQTPPPDDPEVAREVAAIRNELETARLQRMSGQSDAAAAALDTVAARVEATDYGPLLAEFGLERAWALDADSDLSGARAVAETALLRAWRSEQWDLAGDLSQMLGMVVTKQAYPQAALLHARAALGLAERPRSDPRRRGAAHMAMGTATLLAGDLEDAERHHRRALEIITDAAGPTSPEAGTAHNDVAVTLHYLGRHTEAEAEHLRAIEVLTAVFGDAHPEVAKSQDNLGQLYVDMGQYARAEALHRTAVQTCTAALGASHPATGRVTLGLANSLMRHDDTEAAAKLYREALDVLSATIGAHHPDTAAVRGSWGIALIDLGDTDRGLAQLRMSASDQEVRLGAEHPRVAMLRNNLAVELSAAGLVDEAIAQFDAVIDIRERTLGRLHPETLESLRDLAHARLGVRDHDQARADFLEIQARLALLDEPSPRLQGDLLYSLGVIARRGGDLETARGRLESALEIQRGSGERPGLVGHTEFLLARVSWTLGEPDRAVELARAAQASYRTAGPHRDGLRTAVEDWLGQHQP